MAITLGALTLPPGMLWTDRNKYSQVAQSVKRTLGGKPVVFAASYIAGRPVTLESLEDQGWLNKEQVDALQAMAASPLATFVLTVGGESFDVIFRHDDGLAVEADSIIPRNNLDANDRFIGKIKLLTV